MKVYVLIGYDEGQFSKILGIYSTKAKADAACAEVPPDGQYGLEAEVKEFTVL